MFKMLFMDRTTGLTLRCYEGGGGVALTKRQVDVQLKKLQQKHGEVTEVAEGFGILGTIKLLEGHYVVLVTARQRVGSIAGHAVYAVQRTAVFEVSNAPPPSGDEAKYLAMFQAVDLSDQMFFSYTYDLSHSLQRNLCQEPGDGLPLWHTLHLVVVVADTKAQYSFHARGVDRDRSRQWYGLHCIRRPLQAHTGSVRVEYTPVAGM